MYQSSAAFAAYLGQDSRIILARLTYNEEPVSGEIMSLTLYGGSNVEDDFSLGSVISQYIDVEIAGDIEQLENKELLLEIGAMINGEEEWIPMGLFTASRPLSDEGSVTFTAYDRMIKLEKVFNASSLSDPTDTIIVLQELSIQCGVSIVMTGLPAFTMKKPNGYTCREILSYIAQMYGGFAVCNRSGQIVIKTYSSAQYAVLPGRYWDSFEHNDYSYSVAILSCITGKDEDGENIVITAGSGIGRTIHFSNPFMTQAALNNAAQVVSGFQYMPGAFTMLGDPRLDPWDYVTVTDLNGVSFIVPCMVLTHEYDGGLSTTIEAKGKAEEEQSIDFRGPRTKEMDRFYASLVTINEALIGKLDVETARIQYATITSLEALEAHVNTIDGNLATFESLTAGNITAISARIDSIVTDDLAAINADIGTLQADYGNITTILSGNIGTGQLQTINLTAQNTTVAQSFADRILANYAVIQHILAGNIDTNELTIRSTDGGLQISGNLQQFKDANGTTRIQMGKDGNGNYSFSIFDANGDPVWYQDGITADGIPDGILVDSMIAAAGSGYNGISANKLNIQSVKGAIEQGGFSSSLIYFDESQQTLNQVYTQMTSDIDDASDLATQAKNSADSTASQLSSIREMISGIDTLEGAMMLLTNEAHVVHTYNDGTGGIYTDANTTVICMVGETDVTAHAVITYAPSSSVTGTWNNTTKTFQVTALSDMDGYVDFSATYGAVVRYLTTRAGNQFVTRNGNKLKFPSGAAHLSKRFSISKSPDGQIGTSYTLVASALALTRSSTNTLSPTSVTFSALKNTGNSTSDYSGYFKIEETSDWSAYTTMYTSSNEEISTQYIPSAGTIKGIRCTLMDGDNQVLDIQTVVVIADADGMQTDLNTVKSGVQNLTTRMGTVESGIGGLTVSLSETNRALAGMTDGTLLFQTPFTWSADGQTASFKAVVYKAGADVTNDYPSTWFTWFLRTEDAETRITNGKRASIRKADLGYGGTVIGRFTTYQEKNLITRNGLNLKTRSGNQFTIYVQ